MELSKVKKPWFVPAWIWNKGIAIGAEYAKSEARVEKIAALVGDKAGDLMEKAAEGKDPEKVKTYCVTFKQSSELLRRASAALEDCVVSPDERAEIAGAFADVVSGFVKQSEIDAKIDEIAAALRS